MPLTKFSECLKKEFILDIDNFESTETLDGIIATCKLIQTLIILEPGTYINHPDMGVGIKNYRFEFLDSTTLADLKHRIESQINKYIPNDIISTIDVKKIPNNLTGKENTIGVYLKLSKKTEEIKDSVILTFNTTIHSKVISEIYI